jgi:ABC-type bacteriocin/lantibiotic exporter with double-glycine peptidase domain
VKTESAIVEAMGRLTRGRTTFLITHRPSALRNCDLIMRIEGGRVVALEPGRAMGANAPSKAGQETSAGRSNTYG